MHPSPASPGSLAAQSITSDSLQGQPVSSGRLPWCHCGYRHRRACAHTRAPSHTCTSTHPHACAYTLTRTHSGTCTHTRTLHDTITSLFLDLVATLYTVTRKCLKDVVGNPQALDPHVGCAVSGAGRCRAFLLCACAPMYMRRLESSQGTSEVRRRSRWTSAASTFKFPGRWCECRAWAIRS